MNYLELVDTFNIARGDIVTLSSDITAFGLNMIEQDGAFEPNKLIDVVIERLGVDGTLLLPVFNWNFCEGKPFDYHRTRGRTGLLGNVALKRSDFKRTKHPIYSFAVWGRDKEYLCRLDNVNAFYSEDSPFHYLYEKCAKQVAIDVDWRGFFTFGHYVEEREKYPYRFRKSFESDYIDENGVLTRRTYSMYVRYLEYPRGFGCIVDPFENMLAHGGAEEKCEDGINIKIIDLYKAYSLIAECF